MNCIKSVQESRILKSKNWLSLKSLNRQVIKAISSKHKHTPNYRKKQGLETAVQLTEKRFVESQSPAAKPHAQLLSQ